MASAWTENGPISLPPRALALGVGAALCLLAAVGVGLGIRASWRENGALPDLHFGTRRRPAPTPASTPWIAKPIVRSAAPAGGQDAPAIQVVADTADDSKADAIEERTAEAQQVQATTSKSGPDIDQILTSPTEKPTAPAKSAADETYARSAQ